MKRVWSICGACSLVTLLATGPIGCDGNKTTIEKKETVSTPEGEITTKTTTTIKTSGDDSSANAERDRDQPPERVPGTVRLSDRVR